MSQTYFIGVDGGASKCTVRLENDEGHLLGQETAGPASIRLSVAQSWESILSALNKILDHLNISLQDKNLQFHAGMGVAGCEITDAYREFINAHPHLFTTLVVASDAYTACLGAHLGGDGAIIIAGTGVIGFQIQEGNTTKIGGWGFPFDDEGGGAWLGYEAVRVTLKWLDGRLPESSLAFDVYDFFDRNQDNLVTWANKANATNFAELAPLVIRQHLHGDNCASKIIKQAASSIDNIGQALLDAQIAGTKPLPCTLVGGVAPFLEPYLCKSLQQRLTPGQSPPEAGAILMVKNTLMKKN